MDSKRVVAFRPVARAGVIASSLALLAMLVSPTAALADTILGAPASDVPDFLCTFTTPGMDAIQVSTDTTTGYVVLAAGGSIVSWSTTDALGTTGMVGLEVWHLVTPADPVTGTPAVYSLVAVSPKVALTGTTTVLTSQLTKPIPVSPGDLIGIRAEGFVMCGTRTASLSDFWLQTGNTTTPPTGGTEPFPYTSAGRLNISATWRLDAPPPPPPPPPPSTGCDTTGDSQGNDVCTQN